MIWRAPLLVVLQPDQVAAASRGYASSRPLLQAIRLDTMIIETDTPSGLVYCRAGVSNGAVSSLADAQAASNVFAGIGRTITSTLPDAVPIPNGTVYLTALGIVVAQSRMRLWLEVINNQSSDATRVSVTFQGEFIDEGPGELSAILTQDAPVVTAATASGGFKPQVPVMP